MGVFEDTAAMYASEEGAAMYRRKEALHDAARRTTVYRAIDGWDLQGWKVLDVGCGFGRDVAEFRRRGAEAYGCDGSEPLLVEARKEVGDYFTRHDVRSGPLPYSGGFDMVWSCMVLVHVPRQEMPQVVKEMWAQLRQGGRLVLLTKNGTGERVMTNLGEDKPRIMVYYTEQELRSVIVDLGGRVDEAGIRTVLATGDEALELVAVKP
jgi:SAM-dependent methyltransferase